MSAQRKFSLADLRAVRQTGRRVAMLTCYDYTTARLMAEAGINALLVGDSAANVILGHDTTLPVSLDFMIAIAAAVRKGAPKAFVVADMPFGSYHESIRQGIKNVTRMVQLSACDCVKLEAGPNHAKLIGHLADAGVAVMAHLGLRPQSVNLLGGYRWQGRTAREAQEVIDACLALERAGAAAILLEAVPPQVAQAVVDSTEVPVIGCGAGQACHGYVFVTHDALGLTPAKPRFAPALGDLGSAMKASFADYLRQVETGLYPAPQHAYEMPADELAKFLAARPRPVKTAVNQQ
jgi:3-methyl-2-oxobutanoate hydroxymethyltransferase